MKRSISSLSACIVLACILSACAISAGPNESEMQRLAADLLPLTAAVKVTIQTENPPAGLSDSELLNISTREDPSLLKPFSNYKLRISRHSRDVVLLVCSEDGTKGLLEDAGCTPGMDEHLWRSKKPCDFTIQVESLCEKVNAREK